MNKKTEAAAAIERFRDQIKRTHQPNLFTVMTVKRSGNPDLVITAHDVLEMARIITVEQIAILNAKQLNIDGAGTIDSPYKLTTPEQWLWAAVNFVVGNIENSVYYMIGGQLIDVTTNERKASSRHHQPDSFFKHMQESTLQLSDNIAAPENLNILKSSLANIANTSSAQELAPLDTAARVIQSVLPLVATMIQSLDTKSIPAEARVEGYRLVLLAEGEKFSDKLDPKVIVLQKDRKFVVAQYIKNNLPSSKSLELTAQELNNLPFPALGEKPRIITRQENTALVDAIALKFGCTQWDKPYYSSLSTQHNHAMNSASSNMDKLQAITPDAIEKMLVDMRTGHFSDSDMPIGQFPTVLDNLVNHVLTTFLGKDKLKEVAPDINEGRKLFLQLFGDFSEETVKNENPLSLVNKYFSKIKQHPQFLQDPTCKAISETLLGPDAESALRNVSAILANTKVDQHTSRAVAALSHNTMMMEIRAILTGTVQRADSHLPVTIGALFFSESSRYPLCYLASCALLDLMQLNQFCPDLPEIYTLTNILTNPSLRSEFVDGDGRLYSDDEKQIKETLFNNYLDAYFKGDADADVKKANFRKNRKEEAYVVIKKVLAGKASKNAAGYHPMVQGESFDETENIRLEDVITDSTSLVLVQQKIASILLQWLALQLSDNKAITCSLGRKFFTELPKQSVDDLARKKDFLDKHVKPLFHSRIGKFDCMNVQKLLPTREHVVADDFSNLELDRAALESQRSITDVMINGQRKKCVISRAAPDGDCGFTATQYVLYMQDEFETAKEIDRVNFIKLIDKLSNDASNIHKFNPYIVAIFKTDGALNLQGWKTRFSSKGYWLQKEHFALLSFYYNIRFNFYSLQNNSAGYAFVPKLGDESIYEGSAPATMITVNLSYLSTRLLDKPDANLNHFDPIFIEPSEALLKVINEKNKTSLQAEVKPAKSVVTSIAANHSTAAMLAVLSPHGTLPALPLAEKSTPESITSNSSPLKLTPPVTPTVKQDMTEPRQVSDVNNISPPANALSK